MKALTRSAMSAQGLRVSLQQMSALASNGWVEGRSVGSKKGAWHSGVDLFSEYLRMG